MKITKAILRKQEYEFSAPFISGFNGDITEDQLFDFKYLKGDVLGIIIGDNVYEEASTAFDFVEVDIPTAKEVYALISKLAFDVVNYNDYSKAIFQVTECVTECERKAIEKYRSNQ